MCRRVGEVYEAVDDRHSELMKNPWLGTDSEITWTPEVRPTGRTVSIPVTDILHIVSLRHKHVPMRGVLENASDADILQHLKDGLPRDARCCAPRRGRGPAFECHTASPGCDHFLVVDRSSGRPWRLETIRTNASLKRTNLD